MARRDWKAAGYDLDAPVVDAVDVGNVEVNDQGVGGDSRTCFTADTGSCSFQRTPTASWHTWPGAGCAVVAKRVEDATAPKAAFGKWQRKSKKTKTEKTKQL